MFHTFYKLAIIKTTIKTIINKTKRRTNIKIDIGKKNVVSITDKTDHNVFLMRGMIGANKQIIKDKLKNFI